MLKSILNISSIFFILSCQNSKILSKVNRYDNKYGQKFTYGVNTDARKRIFDDKRTQKVIKNAQSKIIFVEGYDIQNDNMIGMILSKSDHIHYVNFKLVERKLNVNEEDPYYSRWFIRLALSDNIDKIVEESKKNKNIIHSGYHYNLYEIGKDGSVKRYNFLLFAGMSWNE